MLCKVTLGVLKGASKLNVLLLLFILQKAQGVDWWWASLCGREGFVPNNYFGV